MTPTTAKEAWARMSPEERRRQRTREKNVALSARRKLAAAQRRETGLYPLVSPGFIAERSAPEPMSGCWLWTMGVNNDGYGWFLKDYVQCRAHRASYEAHFGRVPDGLHVLHRCDTRACVNPAHLFLGTNADNVLDKTLKGRASRTAGDASGNAKLRDSDVITIRARRADGEAAAAIARDYGVCKSTIQRICWRNGWAHIPAQSACDAELIRQGYVLDNGETP